MAQVYSRKPYFIVCFCCLTVWFGYSVITELPAFEESVERNEEEEEKFRCNHYLNIVCSDLLTITFKYVYT